MRVVQKTMEKVVLEVTSKELEDEGFENIWDKVRKVYTTEDYDVHMISFDKNSEDILFIELTYRKLKT